MAWFIFNRGSTHPGGGARNSPTVDGHDATTSACWAAAFMRVRIHASWIAVSRR
jgi:hypothetical protein